MRSHIFREGDAGIVATIVPLIVADIGAQRKKDVAERFPQGIGVLQTEVMTALKTPSIVSAVLKTFSVGVASLKESCTGGVRGIVYVAITAVHASLVVILVLLVAHEVATHLVGGG